MKAKDEQTDAHSGEEVPVDSAGYALLKQRMDRVCSKLSQKIQMKVQMDAATLQECHLASLISRDFHGSTSQPNHIKKAAHIAFWIMKLKPCVLAVRAVNVLSKSLGVDLLIQKNLDADYVSRRKAAEDFLVNEYAAIAIAKDMIEAGYNSIAEGLRNTGKHADAEDLERKLADANLRFARCAGNLAISLREHNYSARAMATMFEIAFTTGYEH